MSFTNLINNAHYGIMNILYNKGEKIMKKILLISLMASLLSLSMTGCIAREVTQDVMTEIPETTPATEETTTVLSDTAPETLRVTPIPDAMYGDDETADVTVFASFEYGDLDPEKNTLTFKFYDYELFDMVDISMLTEGDTIVLSGEDMKINSIERNDMGLITINGGLEEGGTYLRTDGDTVYFEVGMSDVKTYRELGEITIPLSPDMVYSVEEDYGEEPVIYSLEEFKNIPEERFSYHPHYTKIHIENGVNGTITKIEIRWVP